MSRALEEYREVQIDLRLLAQSLGRLNDEEKTHPDKVQGFAGTLKEQATWGKVKADFSKRREALKKQLTIKEERKDFLYLNLSQRPVSLASLAEVIDNLTEVETSFAVDGSANAWDKLTAFIDWLEKDEDRVKGLKAA